MEHVYLFLYLAGIIVAILIRLPYNRQRQKRTIAHQQAGPSETVILLVELLGIVVLPILWGMTSWLDFANYNLVPAAVNPAGNLGIVFMAAALGLLWRAHGDLGSNWSPTLELMEQHQLVTQGIYNYIRHPMYASLLLWCIAQMLMIHNWIAGPFTFIAFLLICFLRIPAEEKMMLEHFGDAYRTYCQRTGRIIPPLRQPPKA